MVVNLGILLIAILIACKAISIFSKKFNNSKAFTNFVNYGTTDRILRIIQFTLLGIVGSSDPHISNLYSYFNLSRLVSLNKIYQLLNLMSDVRKLLRFLKSQILLRQVIDNNHIWRFNYGIFSYNSMSKIFQYIGDIFDLLFYFSNHYFTFLKLGILQNQDLNIKLEFIGNVSWVLNGLFLFLGAFCQALQIKKHKHINLEDIKNLKLCMLQMICQFFQFILGFCFIYPQWQRIQTISLMVIIASVSKLLKFGVK